MFTERKIVNGELKKDITLLSYRERIKKLTTMFLSTLQCFIYGIQVPFMYDYI
jgi:hypothetical protein